MCLSKCCRSLMQILDSKKSERLSTACVRILAIRAIRAKADQLWLSKKECVRHETRIKELEAENKKQENARLVKQRVK